MADDSEEIKYTDLADPAAFKKFQQDFIDTKQAVEALDESIVRMAVNAKGALTGLDPSKFGLKEFQELQTTLKDVDGMTAAQAKSILILQKAQTEYQKTLKELEKQNQETLKTAKLQEEADKKKHVATIQEIADAQIANAKRREAIEGLKASLILQDKEVVTLKKLEAENILLRIARSKLIETDVTYAYQLDTINKKIDANNLKIIQSSDALKKQKLNVGNYADSIRDAFAGTGILGDSISKYLNLVVLLSEKITILTGAQAAQTVAQETEATAAEATTVALESETTATEAATTATGGLSAAMEFLEANPIVAVIAGLVAVGAMLYETATVTQEGRDATSKLGAELKNTGTALLQMSASMGGYSSNIFTVVELTGKAKDLEIELRNERIKNIPVIAALNKEAADARLEAMEANKTTVDQIASIQTYLTAIKKRTSVLEQEAQKEIDIARANWLIKVALNDSGNAEALEALKKAEAHKVDIVTEAERESTRMTKRQASLIKKDYDDRTKMLQDAQKEEIELIDTFSKSKAEHLQKQLDKDIKLNNLETEQKVVNLKHEQDLLGAIDANGVDHTQEFEREINDIRKQGAAKNKELAEKTNDEIAQLNIDFQTKQIELEVKYMNDLNKLDEDYEKQLAANKHQEQEAQLKNINYEVDQEKNKISKLEAQRTLDIKNGKTKYELTYADLKVYYDKIEALNKQFTEKKKDELNVDAKNAEDNEKQKTENAIKALQDKNKALKIENEKAIRNKNPNKASADKEVSAFNSDLDQNELTQIEKMRRDSAAVILGIEQKLQGDLTDADREALKKQEEIEKAKLALAEKAIENRKKLHAEEKKILDDTISGIQQGLQKRNELEQNADQISIDSHKRAIEVQTKLAAAGLNNSLAEQEAAATKAEEKKIQDAKRMQRIQEDLTLTKTFSDTLTKALDQNKPFLQAFGEAAAAEGLVSAMFSKLISGSAFEGTEDTGGKGTVDSKGGKLWVLHPNEGVVNAEGKSEVPGLVTAINKDGIEGVKDLAFQNIYIPQFNAANITTTKSESVNTISYDPKLLNEIKELKTVVQNKPVSSIDEIGLNGLIKEIREGNMTTRIRYKQSNKRSSLRMNG